MYKLKGFIFINGVAMPIKNNISVQNWDEAFTLIKNTGITHYLITLV